MLAFGHEFASSLAEFMHGAGGPDQTGGAELAGVFNFSITLLDRVCDQPSMEPELSRFLTRSMVDELLDKPAASITLSAAANNSTFRPILGK